MAFYNTCPLCGATLDPGERCDCESEQEKRSESFAHKIRLDRGTGQYSFILDGKGLAYDAKIAGQV